MNKGPVYTKSFEFAVRIVNLKKYLNAEKKEFDIAKQVMRSGTSIGANVSEAEHAQSKADFISKLSIALKEANETKYWIRLLFAANFLTEEQTASLLSDCDEVISLLVAIIKNSKKKSA